MTILRMQVALKHTSGLAKDIASNTLYFDVSQGTEAADAEEIFDKLVAFYTALPTGGAQPLYTYFSTEMAQNGHLIKAYRLSDAEPRVPIAERSFNLPAAPNGDPLPGEVALCLSFQGARISGQPQARKRGRIYVGRLDKDSSTAGRPSAPLISDLAKAGDTLLEASKASLTWRWHVYSPTQDAAGVGWVSSAVVDGWVDNAFDTQRRRGLAATSRTIFS